MATDKKTLVCRVSNETYNFVMELVGKGAGKPFESISEYLYTLVIMDLGRRRNANATDKARLKEALQDEEIKNIICDIFRETKA